MASELFSFHSQSVKTVLCVFQAKICQVFMEVLLVKAMGQFNLYVLCRNVSACRFFLNERK